MFKTVVFYYLVNNSIQEKFVKIGCLAKDTGYRELFNKNKEKVIGTLVHFRVSISTHNTPVCSLKMFKTVVFH